MNLSSRTLLALLILLFSTSFQVACQNDLGSGDLSGPPESIRVLWNPADGVVPTPTDLVRDHDLGRLAIPDDEEATAAQRAFNGYLNGLDGYPLSTPIRIPVSGEVAEASMGRGIYLLHAPANERLGVDSYFDHERSEIVVEPRQPLLPRQRYVVGVRGYGSGLVGPSGERVLADAAFFLVRSEAALIDHPDAMPGATEAERMEVAQELTEIQERLAPAFDALAQNGVPREDLAVAFQFTMTSEPAIQFDRAAGEIPMPNDVLIDPDTGLVDLPVDEEMTEEEIEIRGALSQMEGFAMSGAVVVKSTHDVDVGAGDENVFRLFERGDDGGWTEVSGLERGRLDDGKSLWLRPPLALEPEREYVYVVTDGLRSSHDRPHRAQPLGAILRLEAPLVDEEGSSQLDQLTDEEARRLEPLRQRVDELASHLEAEEGLSRHSLAAAVPFRTAGAASHLLDRRAELYERDVTTAVTNIETTMPNDILWQLLTDVEAVVRGEMTILDYLDPKTRAFYEDGEPRERQVKFVMTLPEDVPVEKPLPVVLFGHGLATSRELLYLIAGELASAGYAAFSLDLPYHGDRAICLEDSDCVDDATCDDVGQCWNPDGTEGELKEIQLGYLAPFLENSDYNDLLHYPMTTGEVFIDMHSLVGTRDHFAQAMLDLNQALRVIRGEELTQAVVDETGLWVGDDIVYLGMSLGGILGSGLTAVEPEIETFVLNVPAADLALVIENSLVFESMFQNALADRGIEEGSDDYFSFINATRWLLDPVDPLNLVQHAQIDPLVYEDPLTGQTIDDRQARVLIQMAEGDRVVPNVGTEALSARMGVDHVVYSPSLTDHGFLFDPTPFSTATRNAREDLVEHFDGR